MVALGQDARHHQDANSTAGQAGDQRGDVTAKLRKRYPTFRWVHWLIFVGTKGFNYENNLAYMKFLRSLGIPHQSVIVPEVPHSGFKIYQLRAVEIMQFHATNFASSQR